MGESKTLDWSNRKKVPVKIYQYDLSGNFIKTYGSMSEAHKDTGEALSGISESCNGLVKFVGKHTYRLEYMGEKIDTGVKIFNPSEQDILLTLVNEKRNFQASDIYYKENNGCWEVTSHQSKGLGKDTYPRVGFEGKRWKLSRLVFTLYNERDIEQGMVIMHTCDNPKCINPEHLREGTDKDNHMDMISKGRGVNPPVRSSLNEEQVLAIFNSEETLDEISARFGITKNNVYNIKIGKTWSKLTGKKYSPKKTGLSNSDIIDIYNSDDSVNNISEKYNISKSYVYNIKSKRVKKNVIEELD